MHACTCHWCTCGSQRATSRSRFSHHYVGFWDQTQVVRLSVKCPHHHHLHQHLHHHHPDYYHLTVNIITTSATIIIATILRQCLAVMLRPALISQSSCLCSLSARTTGTHHHALFAQVPLIPFHYHGFHGSVPSSVTESPSFPLRLPSGTLMPIIHVLSLQPLPESRSDRLGTESEVRRMGKAAEGSASLGGCVFKSWGGASLKGRVLGGERRTGAWPSREVGGAGLCGRGPAAPGPGSRGGRSWRGPSGWEKTLSLRIRPRPR